MQKAAVGEQLEKQLGAYYGANQLHSKRRSHIPQDMWGPQRLLNGNGMSSMRMQQSERKKRWIWLGRVGIRAKL